MIDLTQSPARSPIPEKEPLGMQISQLNFVFFLLFLSQSFSFKDEKTTQEKHNRPA
jgi:hypothetical protein